VFSFKEINLFVNNLENKSNEVNSIVRGVESNFGKSFYDLKKCYNQFKKVNYNNFYFI